MTVPQLTRAQSQQRILELRSRGCDVAIINMPDGGQRVMSRCPGTLLGNPTPAPNLLGWLVLGGFAAAALYAIFRPKKAAAAELPPPPQTSACTLATAEDFARLSAWSVAKFIGVIYLPATSVPPSTANSDIAQAFARSSTNAPIVVVTNDGAFWTYETGQPVQSDAYRQDFCNFRPPAAVSGVRWLDG